MVLETDNIDFQLFIDHGVKRGLRDQNGNGVLTGLTNISKIESFKMVEGQKIPIDGRLWYRGYEVIVWLKIFLFKDLVLKKLHIYYCLDYYLIKKN